MHQKDPSLRVAVSHAWKSVRYRPVRQAAAALGVVLAIALFASVRTSQLLQSQGTAAVESGDSGNRMRWLVALSLLMCFAGITNSMLMSVTERFKEIGTMKCLGATNRFIIKVFFLEAMMIGSVASLAGGILGVLLLSVVRAITEGFAALSSIGSISIEVLAVSCAIGTALTVAAAIGPAIQASRMPAVAALRVEV